MRQIGWNPVFACSESHLVPQYSVLYGGLLRFVGGVTSPFPRESDLTT
jgi:hypothetical protein